MLRELTEAQKSRFPEFVEKWTRIGLSIEPADRPNAETAIRQMYAAIGMKPPQIVWCGSPMGNALTRVIMLTGDVSAAESVADSVRASVAESVWDSVKDSVRDNVANSVAASVRDSVADSVWDSVADSVRDGVRDGVAESVGNSVAASVRTSVAASVAASVGDSVGASVWDSVRASVWDSVWASVGDSVGASVRDSVWDSVLDSVRASALDGVAASVRNSVRDSVAYSVGASAFGCDDAHWLAFYDFFRGVCGLVEPTAKLEGLLMLAKSAGWILPHKGICWVSERRCILRLDDAGRIHSTNGPAIAYPDGWEIYAIHGTTVPEIWILNPSSLTPAIALSEQNVERRRAACELLGWERIMTELSPVVIDRDPDPEIGELLQVSHPVIGREKFLRVRCGTGRQFCLAVPPEVETALQANAWTWGLSSTEYDPEVRT